MEQSRRDQIFAAAVKVFERDGFRGASMDDISAEAGASKSLIFYHYKNKIELLARLYRRVGELLFSEVKPFFDNAEMSPVEKLDRIIDTHVRIAIDNQPFFRIYFRERHEIPPEIHEELVGAGERRYVTGIENLIKEGVGLGLLNADNPRVAAYALLGACNWLTHWYRPVRGVNPSLPASAISAQIKQVVLSGLSVRPAANPVKPVKRKAPGNGRSKRN